jgi:hypothetical protein
MVDEKYHMLLPVASVVAESVSHLSLSLGASISSVSCMLDQSGRNLTSREEKNAIHQSQMKRSAITRHLYNNFMHCAGQKTDFFLAAF